jgi:nitronate monooxygenase
VQTLEQARHAAEAGADIIIAQGRDAGGHSGTTRGTIGLVPSVVDAVAPIPVVPPAALPTGAASRPPSWGGASDGDALYRLARITVGPGNEGGGAEGWRR